MQFLLDANTLMNAKNWYYPISRVPEFWDWLIHQGNLSNIKIPIEIYEEFKDKKDKNGQKDELAFWAENPKVKSALLLKEDSESNLVSKVIYEGYLENPTDEDITKMGRDPFLISYALKDKKNRCVVSEENTKPSKLGANKKIPDVCEILGIRCIKTFQLIQELNFTTSWNR